MKKSVVITGGNGVLASYVKNALGERYVIYAPSREGLDITDATSVDAYIFSKKPDAIFHLAAKTNVDECQKYPEEAFKVNSEGTKHIVEAAKKYGAKLFYVSTAAVFSGKTGSYSEKDTPDPVNVYGKSKLLGEAYIRETLPDACIVRIAWLIGGGKHEKKFISYILKNIEVGEKEMHVVSDIKGSIAYAKEVAEFLVFLLEHGENGIYHFASKGIVSRVDIAKKIVSLACSPMRIVPIASSYFESQFVAPRPKNESLSSFKLSFKKAWTDSITEYYETELV